MIFQLHPKQILLKIGMAQIPEKNIDAAELDEERSTLGVVEADWAPEPETNDTSMKNWQTLSIWKDEIGKEEYMPTDEVNCF